MDSYQGIVVADDLTGAGDTGTRFAERGYETAVAASDDAPAADVLVWNTGSRYMDPETAAARVRETIERHDAGVVYKKIDSTLRGNLVAEIDAAVGAAGADLAVVAPAFPANDRTTVGGFHLVGDAPVTGTAAGDDPGAPVTASHVPTLLSDSRYDLARVDVEAVDAGTGAVEDVLSAAIRERDGPVLAVCDATRDAHLEAIALGAVALDATTMYVGSAGLAGHVRLGPGGGVLGVVGSVAPETLDGLDALPEGHVIALDGPRAIGGDDAVDDAIERVLAGLDAGGRAVVTAARSRDDVEATVDAGRDAGLDADTVRDRIAATLAAVVRGVYDRREIGGLFATGGDVATATLDALDGTGIRLPGRSVEPGIPVGRIAGGTADGTPVVTKAGGFGDRETILACLDYLSRHDD